MLTFWGSQMRPALRIQYCNQIRNTRYNLDVDLSLKARQGFTVWYILEANPYISGASRTLHIRAEILVLERDKQGFV